MTIKSYIVSFPIPKSEETEACIKFPLSHSPQALREKRANRVEQDETPPPSRGGNGERGEKAEKGRHFGDEAARTGEFAATLATEAAVPAKLPQPSKI